MPSGIRIKVLIIQPWIRLGGAEIISVHLAHQLNQRGHDAAIACTYVNLDGMSDEASVVTYLKPSRLLSYLCEKNRLLFFLLSPWILLVLVWKHSGKADVLNPHNFPASWVAALVGTFRRIPIIWTCNEPPEKLALGEARSVGLGDFAGWMIASGWLDRLIVRRLNAIYVPSAKTRKQVMDRYGRNAKIIRLGVGKPNRKPKAKSKAIMKTLGLEGSYVLLDVGKLHPQKNHMVSIEALQKLKTAIPNAVLLVAGDGPAYKELKQAAINLGVAKDVKFLGHMDETTLQDVYRSCHVNLFPATNQSWGLTPFEALRFERVSVASNDCGASEVLAGEGIGVVCEPTASAFASSILEIYQNPSNSEIMARHGKMYVETVLTWHNYAENVESLLSQFISPETLSPPVPALDRGLWS